MRDFVWSLLLLFVEHSSRSMSSRDRKVLRKGARIGNYILGKLLGQGGYGDVYEARNRTSGERCALKLEAIHAKKQGLTTEHEFMKQLGDSPYFPKLIEYGEDKRWRYLAMELLGPSLTTIRREIKSRQFSLSTTLRIGIEMLRTIRAFHERGFVHRDVKPSQMLVRASASYPLALIDFGLSKSYMDTRTGQLLPKKEHTGFVGTAKYASIHTHKKKDQGRRDDIFGWFYSLVELRTGVLPWPSGPDRNDVFKVKSKIGVRRLCAGLPPQFRQIYRILATLKFADEPPYDLFISILVSCMEERHCMWSDLYEWRLFSRKKLKQITVIELEPQEDSGPIVPTDLPAPPPIAEELAREEDPNDLSDFGGGCGTGDCLLV